MCAWCTQQSGCEDLEASSETEAVACKFKNNQLQTDSGSPCSVCISKGIHVHTYIYTHTLQFHVDYSAPYPLLTPNGFANEIRKTFQDLAMPRWGGGGYQRQQRKGETQEPLSYCIEIMQITRWHMCMTEVTAEHAGNCSSINSSFTRDQVSVLIPVVR